jgi:hypothetical protein
MKNCKEKDKNTLTYSMLRNNSISFSHLRRTKKTQDFVKVLHDVLSFWPSALASNRQLHSCSHYWYGALPRFNQECRPCLGLWVWSDHRMATIFPASGHCLGAGIDLNAVDCGTVGTSKFPPTIPSILVGTAGIVYSATFEDRWQCTPSIDAMWVALAVFTFSLQVAVSPTGGESPPPP